MKTIATLAAAMLLTACTAAEVQKVGHEISTVERHGIKTGVSIIKEEALLGVRTIREIQEDATQALEEVRREADKAIPPTTTPAEVTP